MDLTTENNELRKGWKAEHEYHKKKSNELTKTCNRKIEQLEKFDYCKTGNEAYLREQIEVIRKTSIQNLIDIRQIIY